MNSELRTARDDFARSDSLDAGILAGDGKAFCPWADLKTFLPKWKKGNMLHVVGRTLDGALGIETLNAYSSLSDFSEIRERLSQFYSKEKTKQKE